MRTVRFLAFAALCAIGLWSVVPAVAQHAAHAHEQVGQCRRGDFLCDHDRFHPVYQLLELLTGRSCCHNSEGRPTHDVKEIEQPTAKQKAEGYRYEAYVDGMWCPAQESALMRISPTQKEQFLRYKKTNPDLFYSFMEFDHAFAPKAEVGPDGKKRCPPIYCIYKKDPPT